MGVDERAIFVAGPVVVFQWRNEAGWPVDYVSPNAAGVFGYSPEAFVSGEISYGALIVAEDAERVGREVKAASEGGATSFVHEPYRIRHRDGTVRWLYDCTNVVRAADGRVTHYLGYVIDITDRVRAEEEKREIQRVVLHSQKLESLGVLAGGVAHDFNNLLAGILGQASLARRALRARSGEVEASLEQIETLATRAAELTRQLLAYSGRGRFVVRALDLDELVRDMARMLEVVVSKSASIELALAGSLPAVVADPTEIRQIVMNLITNASEAIGDRTGVIRIRTSAGARSAEELATLFGATELAAGPYVSLEVSDDGCGMDESVLAKLFDPFFTTKASGRGLGMSAVQGIVRGHRGAIRVRSTPGRGSTFEVIFPSTSEAVVTGEAGAAHAPWPRGGVVLVVDDEEHVRKTAAQLLEELGFRTLLAADGAQALEVHRAHASDIVLVLLDMTMPVMNGAEAHRALRERDARLPVLLSSGWSEHDPIFAIPRESTTGFLEKPYRLEDLERAVAALLSQARAAARNPP